MKADTIDKKKIPELARFFSFDYHKLKMGMIVLEAYCC
jgi:hypothetical protein